MKERINEIIEKIKDDNDAKIAYSVLKIIREYVDQPNLLSNDEIQFILRRIDCDGCFKIFESPNMPSDVRFDLHTNSTYYIALLLIKLKLDGYQNIDEEKFDLCLRYCANRYLMGHGLYGSIEQRKNVLLFLKNGTLDYFLYMLPSGSTHPFFIMLREVLEYLISIIRKNGCCNKNDELLIESLEKINLRPQKIYYLAYGSNLNVRQMKNRCPNAVKVGTSIIEGYKLKFDLYLNIVLESECNVPVGIWLIDENDEKSLDRYEGFPKYYTKEYLNVKIGGDYRKCLVYIMNKDRKERTGVKPTDEYFLRVLQGYKDFNLDVYQLCKAYTKTLK